ncbi:kinesin motor catalytic domain protein (macronuclear) [Tetrahymena thermophila SB210]|uniref:Kinesin motor catalytic domain protein n=1 Tax=Tetrahymena thermophila (strain SB210) TaxID=312017 RepID=Q24I94_TETTS|nr:kinesin motor catalytic domain protein [Tetrahymena thermophila SB210]EAS07503.2 kinesin motor catalytic domain protein [Tetrahymena thermophila SB210]|eukprot:XP_001027745.2 kinesin motor catalytic domain protein [Tetrahymena thermophila SB210]
MKNTQKQEKNKEQTPTASSSSNTGNIKVVCRVRPPNKKEIEQFEQGQQRQCIDFASDEKTIKLNIPDAEKYQFTFDRIFAPDTTQQAIYEYSAKPVVQSVLEGYNGTVFAYGQTSSGKTHTMQGPSITDQEQKGIVPRMVTTVFQHVNTSPSHIEFKIKLSIVEIYLEKIKDLLDPSKVNLTVREDRTHGVYIQDVTEKYVTSEKEVFSIIDQGNQNRSVAYTNMNEGSSRSHMLFIMTVYQNNLQDLSAKSGKLFLVDLAGSEKISKTGAEGKVLDEAKKINQSLSSLGNVINALTDGKSQHVPYRDSKLTRVLQESLGGNSTTTLIITCSPSSFNDQETLSTLRFGMRAKCIKNKPKINREYTIQELQLMIQNQEKIIDEQKKQIRQLEKQIENGNFTNMSTIQTNNSDTLNTSQEITETDENIGSSAMVDKCMELEAQLEAEKAKCSSYAYQLNQVKNELSNVTSQMEAFQQENEVMANKLTQLAFLLNDLETEMINNKFNMEKSQSSKQAMMQQISQFRKIQEQYKNQFSNTLNNHFNKNQRVIELVGDDVKQINKDLLLVCQTKLSEEEFKLFLNQMIVQKNTNQEEIPIADYNNVQQELEQEKQLRLQTEQELQTAQEENSKLLKIQEQLQADLSSKNSINSEANKELNEIQLNKERQQFKQAKEKILDELKEKVNKVLVLESELENQKSLAKKYEDELKKKENDQQFKIEYLEKNLERMMTMYENLFSKMMLDKRQDDQEQKLKEKEKQIQKLEQKLNESMCKNYVSKNQIKRLKSFQEEEQINPKSTNNILSALNNDFQNNFGHVDDGNDTDKTEINRTVNSSDFSQDPINESLDDDNMGDNFIQNINNNQNMISEDDQNNFDIFKKSTQNFNHRRETHHRKNRSNSTAGNSPTSKFQKPSKITDLHLDFTLLEQQNLNRNLNNSFSAVHKLSRKKSEPQQYNLSQFNQQHKIKSQQEMLFRGNSSQSLNASIDYGKNRKNQPSIAIQRVNNDIGFDIQEVDDDNVSEAYNSMNNPQNFAFNNKNFQQNKYNQNNNNNYRQQQNLFPNNQIDQYQSNQQQFNSNQPYQQQIKQLPVKVSSLNIQGLNLTSNNMNYPYSTQPSSRIQTARRKYDDNNSIVGDDNDYYNILKSTETEGNTNNSEMLSSQMKIPVTPSSIIMGQSNQKNLPFVDYMMNQQKNLIQNTIIQRKNTNNFNQSQVNTTETSDSGKGNNKKITGSDILRGNPALSPFINTFSFKLLNLQTNCIYAY